MKKILWAGLFIIGGIAGVYFRNNFDMYKLDYTKVAVNVPVVYEKYLTDKKYALGEKYLAENLAAEFNRQGMNARVFSLEGTYLNRRFNYGFDVFMRSFPELQISSYHNYIAANRFAVLYETIPYKLKEVKNADIVFTGSLKKEKEYLAAGINAYFIPQFTNTERFYYAPNPKYHHRLLYIANQWPDFPTRKTVTYAVKNQLPLDIIGANWWDALKENQSCEWVSMQVANEDLKYYYSSSDIILNDTRQDMIDAGFISNRIFDVTACKGFLISDYIPEIEEIYGDSIPMYKTEEEFVELIRYYLNNPQERREKALKAHKITMENFTAEKSVKKMLKIMREYAEKKGVVYDD